MQQLSVPDDAWRRVAPDLDEALAQLARRIATLSCSGSSMARITGRSAWRWVSARRRQEAGEPGLEKLRAFFAGRGLMISVTALASLMRQMQRASAS